MIEIRPQNNASTYGYLDVLPHIGDLITLDKASHRVTGVTHFPRRNYRTKAGTGNEFEESHSVIWVGPGRKHRDLKAGSGEDAR